MSPLHKAFVIVAIICLGIMTSSNLIMISRLNQKINDRDTEKDELVKKIDDLNQKLAEANIQSCAPLSLTPSTSGGSVTKTAPVSNFSASPSSAPQTSSQPQNVTVRQESTTIEQPKEEDESSSDSKPIQESLVKTLDEVRNAGKQLLFP